MENNKKEILTDEELKAISAGVDLMPESVKTDEGNTDYKKIDGTPLVNVSLN